MVLSPMENLLLSHRNFWMQLAPPVQDYHSCCFLQNPKRRISQVTRQNGHRYMLASLSMAISRCIFQIYNLLGEPNFSTILLLSDHSSLSVHRQFSTTTM